MNKFQNVDYLKSQQYAGADKLAARIRLHEQYSTGTGQIQPWEFDRILIATPEQATILEVGCGRGDLWQQNAERIPPGWQITLTDLSAGMLADCQRHLGAFLAQGFEFNVADVQALPFETAQFDVVIANYMLYHVPNLAQGIAEIRRVLKPGGTFFAMTNGDNHMIELESLINEFRQGDTAFGLMGIRGAFTLQNGADALRQQFRDVEREDFDTGLRVTELQPLLDYVASTLDNPDVQMQTPHALALRAELQRQIDTEGAIDITKETGLFMARGVKEITSS